MERPAAPVEPAAAALTVRMFGQLVIDRDGVAVGLPPSRKVRALLGYLALAPHAVGRSRLCELLGDVPNDPKGELRWCLSKLRAILDQPGRTRVSSRSDMVRLDLEDCFVDALKIEAATRMGLQTLDLQSLRGLCSLFAGDFLEGLDLHRSPQLDHWLVTQRSRYRASHAALLEQLVRLLQDQPGEARPYVERWVALSPFDTRAQVLLLKTLLGCGLPAEAERHLAAIERLFEAEDLDITPIRQAWRDLRRGPSPTSPAQTSAIAASEQAEPFTPAQTGPPARQHRASLAVMPFMEPDRPAGQAGMAEGLTHDIITRLAKLRNLFIIARGSVFALSERGVGAENAAKRLNVDYFATGMVRRSSGRILVSVELVEARTTRIVWSDEFDLKPDDAFLLLDDIGNMIVSAIANEVETAEKNRAVLKPPNSLNAWESYHRGLWHMYRFTQADNDLAYHFFKRSSEADPTFARALAGISFTHWQNAFQNWADRDRQTDLAYEAAGRSLIVDDHDPAAHWAMGRALWLRRRHDHAIGELKRAVDLSPNFALGHYALSFVESQTGNPTAAIASSDQSRSLSPFDPLLFAMLGARAMAHVRLGQYEEAAEWAIKATARPNAHNIILAIAAHCLALAGRIEEARAFAALLRKALPDFTVEDFLASLRFPAETEALFRSAAARIGLG